MGRKLQCICLLLVCAALADASMPATIVQGEIPQKDASRPTYRLRLPQEGVEGASDPQGANSDLPPGATRMRMVSAQGQVLQCMVPSPSPLDKAALRTDSETAFDDVDFLLRKYENKCFVREEGWWTFEFWYNKEIIQVHKPRDENDEEDRYVLGSFNKEFDLARRKNVSEVSKTGAHFTQLYGNGTKCSVTGRAREIVVKYICADDAMQMKTISKHTGEIFLIKGIRELSTCVYELEFISTAICRQNLYKSTTKRSALDIKCELEKGQGAFKGLATKRYRRASLTL